MPLQSFFGQERNYDSLESLEKSAEGVRIDNIVYVISQAKGQSR